MLEEKEFTHCDNCTNPDACITRCGFQEQWIGSTNIAEQRGETPEQLWGDSE